MKASTLNLRTMRMATLAALCFSLAMFNAKAQQADTVLKTPLTGPKTVRVTNSITLDTGFYADAANGTVDFGIVGTPIGGCVALGATPSADRNYIVTMMPRTPIDYAVTLASSQNCEVSETIQYFDGLGRPLQTVQVKASPSGNDIVHPTAYDQWGRETVNYLSYTTASGTPGSYRANALDGGSGYGSSAQLGFYHPGGTPYSTAQLPGGIAHIPTPYSETRLEVSPLGRPLEQGAPGDAWQPDGTTNPSGVASGHTVKMEYRLNTDSASSWTGYWAKRYRVMQNATTGARSLQDRGSYPANRLTVTVTKDENWTSAKGKLGTTEEYKNYDGRVVLKRTFNNNNTTNEVLSTYYVYDDLGNLCYVLPPKAEPDNGTITATILNNLCYQYKYDDRQRSMEKRIPGSGWQYMVYNKLDQITATQDSNQRASGQWIITKYDALGRTIVSGIWNSGATRTALQGSVEAQTTQWEARDNTQTYGYTLASTYPVTLNTILSVSYYDNYSIPNLPSIYDYHTTNSILTRGLATASLTNVLGTSDMLWTVNYYDDKARKVNTYAQHYLGGTANLSTANYDHVSSTYDFTNAVINTTRQHYANSGGTPSLALTLKDSLVYDHAGRKRQTWSRINSDSTILLVQNDYNEVGQALNKRLHSEDRGATYLQDIGYAYNERGWMTTESGSKFNLSLAYNTGITTGATAQYNGNIAEMYSASDKTAANSRFNYSYDALNRLTAADHSNGTLTENGITYDKMGNIIHLGRSGANAATLSYTYASNSNQLASVTNSGSAFRTYSYDGNGNATTDGTNRGISYNMLNLPQTVTNNTTSAVLATYTYESSGAKIRNTGSDGTWDYVSGIVYHNGAIDFVSTEEGRAIPNGSHYSYQYNLKDHLGNTRVSLNKNGVLQEDEYYAFGLRNPRYDNSSNNRYLYNGKEIQTDLANQYDYGARFYDAVIGRWTSVDPLAEKYRRWSTYNYGADNPMRFIDPDGMGIWDKIKSWLNSPVDKDYAVAVQQVAGATYGTSHMPIPTTKGETLWMQIGTAALQMGQSMPGSLKIPASSGRTATVEIPEISSATSKSPTTVTPEVISNALEGSTVKTTQSAVSLPKVQEYVNKIAAGSEAPAIKVAEGNIIVEGNHRYVAGRVAGVEPATVPATLSPSQKPFVQPIQSIKIDPLEWPNH